MKTKKLIKLLQEADPSGELECNIGGEDIFIVEAIEGYWNGCYQVLIRDEENPYYNVVGAEYRSDGTKVHLITLNIEDALLNDPDLPIKVVDVFSQKKMQKTINKWREEAKKVLMEIEKVRKDVENG